MSEAFVLDVGSAVEALQGETVSGDVVFTRRIEEHRVLVLLADGLGHGAAAAEAAARCVTTLALRAETSLEEAFLEAHRNLRGGRGAVAAAVLLDGQARSLRTAVIGNIVVRQVGTRKGTTWSMTAVATPGVLGGVFRSVPIQQSQLELGDVIVVHSDGVRSHFETVQVRATDARSAAEEIVARHGRGRDDASCAVVRVLPHGTVVSSTQVPGGKGSGTEVILRIHSDIQVAATMARAFARDLGMSGRGQWELSIAAAELAQNAIKYGVEGLLRLSTDAQDTLVLEVADRGSGFGAAEQRPGLREGLGAVQRMMDSCEVYSGPTGTRVIAKKRIQ